LNALRLQFEEVEVIAQEYVWLTLPNKRFDVLVVFQNLYSPEVLAAFGVSRTVLVPMYDACPLTREFWDGYRAFGILCFSKTLFSHLRSWGLEAMLATYYPPVPDEGIRQDTDGLAGYFWPRALDVNWGIVKTLMGTTRFDHLHLHVTGRVVREHVQLPDENDRKSFNLHVSSWFNSPADYLETLRGCQVYFAPRSREGIGMSFLEAMSIGLCVVAADNPTMSEYIHEGENGLLFDLAKPRPLDFSRVRLLGKAARESCRRGNEEWNACGPAIQEFLRRPSFVPVRSFRKSIIKRGRIDSAARKLFQTLVGVTGARFAFRALRTLFRKSLHSGAFVTKRR
jgi:hypothetical protein